MVTQTNSTSIVIPAAVNPIRFRILKASQKDVQLYPNVPGVGRAYYYDSPSHLSL